MPMPNDRFFDIVGAVFQRCLEVLNEKGPDYAGEDNRLRNFEEDAAALNLPTWKVLQVWAQKHEKAIRVFRETGKVNSEAPEMRYVDRINYLLLDLADAIANGYEPREAWLTVASRPSLDVTPTTKLTIIGDNDDQDYA